MRVLQAKLFLVALVFALANPVASFGQDVFFFDLAGDAATPGAYQGTTFDGMDVTFVAMEEMKFGTVNGLLIENATGDITLDVSAMAMGSGAFAAFANRDIDGQRFPVPIKAYGTRSTDDRRICFTPTSGRTYKPFLIGIGDGIVDELGFFDGCVYKWNPDTRCYEKRNGRIVEGSYKFYKKPGGGYKYEKRNARGKVIERGCADWA